MGGSIGRTVAGVATAGASELFHGNKAFGGGLLGRGLSAGMTGGLSEFTQRNPFGVPIGGFGGSRANTPGVGGSVSPMQALMYSGGAPLLSSIAMGSDPKQAIASYFGAKDYDTLMQGLDPASQAAVTGLTTNLTNISNNTQMRTQAVQNLVNDFPNFMQSEIPKYKGIADQATQDAANLALSKVGAKYAAGGGLSSGAVAAAAARTGAEFGERNLQYGTELAGQDWANKYNSANALLNFQQKMLGQGAQNGFNAVQKMLEINAGVAGKSAELGFEQSRLDQSAQAGMWGGIGRLGGTLIGAGLGGPTGAAIGGQLGGGLANGSTNTPFGYFGWKPSGNPDLNY